MSGWLIALGLLEHRCKLGRMNDPTVARWLASETGGRWLRDAAQQSKSQLALSNWLRQGLSASLARAVIEQIELRRRAVAKFDLAAEMLFERTALEQATDQHIAAYKAVRFAPEVPRADLCCGIGGDLLALAAGGPTIAVERSAARARLAQHNARIAGSRAQVIVGAISRRWPISAPLVHIDPDRRIEGHRTSRPELSDPPIEEFGALVRRAEGAAVKLSPAAAVPFDWQQEAELEWISRGGECRQLIAWFGALARAKGCRRATMLIASDVGSTQTADWGSPMSVTSIATLEDIGTFVFDPDPAFVAARMVDDLAAKWQLERIDSSAAYLTGNVALNEPALAPFRVCDVLPLDRKRLRGVLRQYSIGTLEIKQRGVSADLERLRRELKLSGDAKATLILTRCRARTIAILADRSTTNVAN